MQRPSTELSKMAVWYKPNVGLLIEGAALTTDLLRHNAQAFLRLCQARGKCAAL